MTTKNSGKQAALVAALTMLGASLGVGAVGAQAADQNTSTQLKGDTTSTQHKVTAQFLKLDTTQSTQLKGETSSKQFKFWTPSSTQIKDGTTSTQHKGTAPSAQFLKLNTTSTQIKGETTSTQHKGELNSTQIKMDSTGGSQH